MENHNHPDTIINSKILIVDNEVDNINVLSTFLEEIGFTILVAIDGQSAIKIAINNSPDIILLDIMMPEMNGYECCIFLKEKEITKDIPVIFVSARTSIEDMVKGFDAGTVDYITKPFNFKELFVRLRTHIELKKYRDQLKKQALIDPLTDIPNRKHFEDYLNNEWKRALRNQIPISLIIIDIDYFKKYNDTLGHVAGDICLKKVAKILISCIHRPADRIARYGGEEFICILPETDMVGANTIAQQLNLSLSENKIEHPASEINPYITISQGVSSIVPSKNSIPKSLIEMADKNLYTAKNNGRNQIFSS